ncbi:hypothetical protein S7711_07511 [Stachybotrys chartarum IBT 7711]|uniref:Cytidyltransferase-like domain-containing protein n=1 Tax=Stachybotrys chartarum (strain CBS 109288 / IBT 7711) TaxID=1280523 RepID=A0A084AK49_STACB|nr:hypothetical protein S7711_07511 [Stachybotrys chartarum IBT 7711]
MPSIPNDSPHLLLLPAPPRPATHPTLNAAYRTPITSVLTKLGFISSSASVKPAPISDTPTRLVVALTAPVLSAGYAPRVHWKYAQSLLAGLYSILAAICAEHSIDADLGDGSASLDATVILVDHVPGKTYRPGFDGGYTDLNGTTIRNLPAFASLVYPWATVFHASSEPGYQLLSAYLSFAEGHQSFLQNQLVAVDSGLSLSTEQALSAATGVGQDDVDLISAYKSVCFGGTFDHLHPGHKLLIQATALLVAVPKSDKQSELIIGISADELLKNKKYSEELQSWEQRARNVLAVLSTTIEQSTHPAQLSSSISAPKTDELHATFRSGAVLVRCVAIRDPFGPPIHEQDIFAIVVSGETRSGGQAINDKRHEKGWPPLEVFEIDVLDASGDEDDQKSTEDFSTKISSTAIRRQKAAKRTGTI